jgi:hypothetical protein
MSRGRDLENAEGRNSSPSVREPDTPASERAPATNAADSHTAQIPTHGRTSEHSGARHRSAPRQVHRDREHNYRLRESEIAALIEIGKFRTVRPEDLVKFQYDGDRDHAKKDLRNLTAEGLIEKRTMHGRKPGQLLTLTRNGKKFIEQSTRDGSRKQQTFHQGFVKPREARHDAALYRLYQKAAEGIERDGGKNLRVVLDYELKKDLYRDLATLKTVSPDAREDRRQEIAQRHGLKVVNGKIPLPDVRIEYENRADEQARLDLELATSDYRSNQLAEKAQAGFSIYAPADEAGQIRRALQDARLMTEILSL